MPCEANNETKLVFFVFSGLCWHDNDTGFIEEGEVYPWNVYVQEESIINMYNM